MNAEIGKKVYGSFCSSTATEAGVPLLTPDPEPEDHTHLSYFLIIQVAFFLSDSENTRQLVSCSMHITSQG